MRHIICMNDLFIFSQLFKHNVLIAQEWVKRETTAGIRMTLGLIPFSPWAGLEQSWNEGLISWEPMHLGAWGLFWTGWQGVEGAEEASFPPCLLWNPYKKEVLATSSDSHLGSDNSSGTRESEPQREGKYLESAIGNCSGYSCMQIWSLHLKCLRNPWWTFGVWWRYPYAGSDY